MSRVGGAGNSPSSVASTAPPPARPSHPLFYQEADAKHVLTELGTDEGLKHAIDSGVTIKLSLSPPGSAQHFVKQSPSSPSQLRGLTANASSNSSPSPNSKRQLGRSLVSRLTMKKPPRPQIITSADVENELSRDVSAQSLDDSNS